MVKISLTLLDPCSYAVVPHTGILYRTVLVLYGSEHLTPACQHLTHTDCPVEYSSTSKDILCTVPFSTVRVRLSFGQASSRVANKNKEDITISIQYAVPYESTGTISMRRHNY
jgi:hypothetical protein